MGLTDNLTPKKFEYNYLSKIISFIMPPIINSLSFL